MGGSSSQQQPTQTTQTNLSPQAQQLFSLAYPNIAAYAAGPPPQRYPGSTTAPFNPAQTQAQELALGTTPALTSIANRSNALAAAIPGMLDWSGTAMPGPVGGPSWNPVGSVVGMPQRIESQFSRTPLETSSNIFQDRGIWNPEFNVGLSNAITAAQRPTWQALTEQALPAIRNQAIATGPYGGSRQSLAEGLATARATQTAGDIAARMAEDVYNANLQAANARYLGNINALNQRYGIDVGAETAWRGQDVTQRGQDISGRGQDLDAILAARGQDITARGQDIGAASQRYGQNLAALYQTLGLTPMLQQTQMYPAQVIGGVGDVGYQMDQAQLNDAINAWNYGQTAQYQQARDVMGLLASMPGASTTSTANVPKANPWMQALGGASAGAAIGSAVPMVGTGVGALGGALLPFLFA